MQVLGAIWYGSSVRRELLWWLEEWGKNKEKREEKWEGVVEGGWPEGIRKEDVEANCYSRRNTWFKIAEMDDIVSAALSLLVWFYVFSCQPSTQQPMHPALYSTCFIFSFSSLFHASLYDSGVEDSPWLPKGSQSVLYSYWWVWGIFIFRRAFGIGGTKERKTHATAKVSFFACVLLLYIANLLLHIWLCLRSRKSPSNTLVGSHGIGCNRLMWILSFNGQLCPCSWSQLPLQTGLLIFHRNTSPVL